MKSEKAVSSSNSVSNSEMKKCRTSVSQGLPWGFGSAPI